jgi:hypothetical protein
VDGGGGPHRRFLGWDVPAQRSDHPSDQTQAAFFYRFAGEPDFTDPAVPSFVDVPVSHTFFTEIEWLAATGIGGGFSDGTFRPRVTVSRQTAAAFFFRYDEAFGATVPGAPTGVVAVAADGEATVSWTAPAADGGSPITGYRVTVSPGGAMVVVAAPAAETVVGGLTNGTSYTFTVAAQNSKGYGSESAPSDPVTPQAGVIVPGAPTGVFAVAGDGEATVTWTPPTQDGGSPITAYRVTASPGGLTVEMAPPATEVVVDGLMNGVAYSFTVAARNGVGWGAESSPSSPVTPMTVPGAPTEVEGVAGNGEVTVSWTSPADDGGSPMTGYRVTVSPGGATVEVTAPDTDIVVAGLTNGVAYTFTVAAENTVGYGPESAVAGPVTPEGPATVPGAPTGVSAVAGDGEATVSWVPPADVGGSPVTTYRVTVSPGGVTVEVAAPATEVVVDNLTNGVSYTFTVAAENAVGFGPESAPARSTRQAGSRRWIRPRGSPRP